MRFLQVKLVGATLAATLALAPTQEAKADGGALVGVGVYLVGDYAVGRKCRMRHWPFNIVTKVAYGLHGKRVCRYYRKRY